MGGGRKYMFPKNKSDVEYPGIAKHSGTRNDGRNLVQEWTDRMKDKVNFSSSSLSLLFSSLCSPFYLPNYIYIFRSSKWLQCYTSHTVLYICVFLTVQKGHYVWNKKQLLSLNPANVDYLLGEFLASVSLWNPHWSVNEEPHVYAFAVGLFPACNILFLLEFQVSLNPGIWLMTWRGTLRLILRWQRWWKWPSRSWRRTPVDFTCLWKVGLQPRGEIWLLYFVFGLVSQRFVRLIYWVG